MAKTNGRGRTKRESFNLAARRDEGFRRWSAGETQGAIAKALKVSPASVCTDLQIALAEWREANRASVNEAIEREWQLLNWCQLEAQLNYEMCKIPKDRAHYLELIVKIGMQRRKLLGLDKPSRIEAQTTTEVSLSSNFKTLDELKADIIRRRTEMEARMLEMATDQAEVDE